MIRFLIALLIFGYSLINYGQESDCIIGDSYFQLKGIIKNNDKNIIGNINVTLTGTDSTYSLLTESNGSYEYPEILASGIYSLSFEKKGLVKKSVLIDFTLNDKPIQDGLSILDLSPTMIEKKKRWGYKRVEKDFYLLKVFVTEDGYVEIDTDFSNIQSQEFQDFIKKKHHYAKD
jgi:hypothetical protein